MRGPIAEAVLISLEVGSPLHPRSCHRYITREACSQARLVPRDESRLRPKIPRCSRFEEKTDCPFLARYKSDATWKEGVGNRAKQGRESISRGKKWGAAGSSGVKIFLGPCVIVLSFDFARKLLATGQPRGRETVKRTARCGE